jgi:hypothetical protein
MFRIKTENHFSESEAIFSALSSLVHFIESLLKINQESLLLNSSADSSWELGAQSCAKRGLKLGGSLFGYVLHQLEGKVNGCKGTSFSLIDMDITLQFVNALTEMC